MNLPKIDISALPHLDGLTGMFGSTSGAAQTIDDDDAIVALMTFLYEVTGGG